MLDTIKKQWFLVCLVVVFAAVVLDQSLTLVDVGKLLKQHHAPQVIIFVIFIISGLLIDSQQILAGLKDIKATLAALFVILVFAPAIASLLVFTPLETGVLVGMFIVAVMPTTLSSGVVMTGKAGGNMAHALFITILTNFITIFTIPVLLPALLSMIKAGKSLSIDQGAILFKLIVLVLIPLAVGMVIKGVLCRKIRLPEKELQIINQVLIVGIVFISLSGSRQTLIGNWHLFFVILVLAVIFHLLLLGACFVMIKWAGITKGRYESVVFMGAQKTLAIAAMIQVTYFSEFGTALLVCVVHHIVHLMMDGYLSARMQQTKAF